MQIATVSDIHGHWNEIIYPPADVLIFAGDILKNHLRDRTADAHAQLTELARFSLHCETLLNGTYKHIVFCPGNHDWCFDKLPKEAIEKLGPKVIYLHDRGAIIDGVKFYGSGWTPWFWDWALNHPNPGKDPAAARRSAQLCWAAVPDDTNVLVTHGPPQGILDLTKENEHVGCPHLKDAVVRLLKNDLKLHVFGHIHHSYGKTMVQKTLFVNTSICTERYTPDNPVPIITIHV